MSNVELEERLCDAAFRGDVAALTDLLVQDPNLLDKHHLKCEDKNVLHVAAMLGNVAFFQAVLQASSSLRHDLCLARDRDGKNPVHLAASHGKLEILKLIKDDDWLVRAALEKADNGGTILHLCVKHNQLDALRLLLGLFTHDSDFQEAKNEDGMTILHLAFYYNQNQRRREVIIHLIKHVAVIVNSKNGDGKTALDIFLEKAGVYRIASYQYSKAIELMRQHDEEITYSLLRAYAQQGPDIPDPNEVGFGKRKDVVMVVASLMATMAFQAMISPPGGTWQDDLFDGYNSHRAGQSVMAHTHPEYYKHLMKANTVSFVSSLSIIILLIRGMGVSSSSFFLISTSVMWLSVAAIAIVYSISVAVVVPESVRGVDIGAVSHIAIIPITVWSLIVFAMFVELWKFSRIPAKKPSNSNVV